MKELHGVWLSYRRVKFLVTLKVPIDKRPSICGSFVSMMGTAENQEMFLPHRSHEELSFKRFLVKTHYLCTSRMEFETCFRRVGGKAVLAVTMINSALSHKWLFIQRTTPSEPGKFALTSNLTLLNKVWYWQYLFWGFPSSWGQPIFGVKKN